jgi:3-oxoacyl-[acyl-carrier-protein] synthase II
VRKRVVVTGVGLLTPFGFGEKSITDNIFHGKHAFRKTQRYKNTEFHNIYTAESEFQGTYLELGIACTEQAMHMAQIPLNTKADVILGTSGDFYSQNSFWQDKLRNQTLNKKVIDKLPFWQAKKISEYFNIRGNELVFNNGCIASTNSIAYAYELIAQGKIKTAICGGYSLVSQELIAKFQSGRAFSRDGVVKPFSKDRTGLLLGDGGAIFILESLEDATERGVNCLAEILGWGIASDAYHITQPHPQGIGMASAIKKAMTCAKVTAKEIDYINAHGTGTPYNDVREALAIKNAFGDQSSHIPVSSTKSMTGHILEGTGALETAISIFSLKYGIIPPTANHTLEDPDCDLDIVKNEPREKNLNVVLNLNASFGGNNIALIMKKIVV